MNVDELWKSLADYLNFFVDFIMHPEEVLKPYKGKGSVDAKLVSFGVVGIGLSLIVALGAGGLGVADETSNVLRVIRSIDIKYLPLVSLLLISLSAVVFHISIRAYLYLRKGKTSPSSRDPYVKRARNDRLTVLADQFAPFLGGNIKDSINASLAFGAFYVPVVTSVICAILVFDEKMLVGRLWLLISIPAAMLSFCVLIYFPAAISGCHPNTTFKQALASWVVVTMIFSLLFWVSV